MGAERGGGSARNAHLPTILLLAFVTAVTLWNGLEASQHLLTDRDQGVNVTAARWLVREGSLLVDPAVGPFADQPSLRFEEQGWNLDDQGRLEPQFLHLLPIVLAGAHVVGGDRLLLLAPAVLGGLGLLAVHAFARRLVRPWWALAATVTLGINLVWVQVSRDAFSEVPGVVLLFGGLAMLWRAWSAVDLRLSVAAGLLLGAVATTRVEGFLLLAPLVVAMAAPAVVAQLAPAGPGAAAERRVTVRRGIAVVGGALLTAAVGLGDLVGWSTWYLGDLRALLAAVAAALVVTAGACALALGLAARHRRRAAATSAERPPRARPAPDGPPAVVADVAAGAVVVAALAAWVLRPRLVTVRGGFSAAIADVERQEGLVAEGVRRYSEHSVQWLSWYLGPLVLLAGIAGTALVVRGIVRSRGRDLRLLPFLAVFATISCLYLWRPSITPDHVWAMRRYALVTIPGLVVLAAVAGQHLLDRLRAHGARRGGAVLVGACVAIAIAFPLRTVAPVAGATTQEGMLEKVGLVCDAVGPDGAVVVAPGRPLDVVAAQALRSFCGVPVAIAGEGLTRAEVAALARAWADQGRELHVLGVGASAVEGLSGAPVSLRIDVPNDQQLGATLTRRPDELVPAPYTFVLGPVAPLA